MGHKYAIGQEVALGKITATVQEHRRFWSRPSYMLNWKDKAGNTVRGVFTEKEIDESR